MTDAMPPSQPEQITLNPVQAITLIVGGIIISLFFFEIVVRGILIPMSKKELPTADRPAMYFLPERPERDATFFKKKKDEFRIVVLGDSFTYGLEMQLNDAFPAKLEHYLNLNLNQRPVRVINLGHCGYSTTQEVESYIKRAQELGADMVVIEITLNDPEMQPYRVTHPYLDEHGKIKLTSPIFKYWKGLNYITSRILNMKIAREYREYYFDLFNTPENWNRMTASLQLLKRNTEEAKIPLVGVVFPLFNGKFDDSYPYTSLHEKLIQYLRGMHVRALDLLPSFKGMQNDRLQIRPGVDSHPNEIAHRIAAESLLGFLHKQGLLPKDVFPTNLKGTRK